MRVIERAYPDGMTTVLVALQDSPLDELREGNRAGSRVKIAYWVGEFTSRWCDDVRCWAMLSQGLRRKVRVHFVFDIGREMPPSDPQAKFPDLA